MSDRLARLHESLEDIRDDLGKQWNEIAAEAGVSLSTLGRVRNGTATRTKRRAVERVLGLAKDAIEDFLSGKADILKVQDPTRREPDEDPPLIEEQRKLILVYEAYVAQFNGDEALAAERFVADVREIIAIRERRKRPTG